MSHNTASPLFSDTGALAPPARLAWAERLRQEVTANVLPWWQREMFDDQGRVLGGRGNDGALRDLPRTAVLGTRLLWTFASAQVRLGHDPATAQAAQRAWDWVRGPLTDTVHGGVYWSVDGNGQALAEHKQSYAQAFNIYALTACHAWQCAALQQPLQSSTPALQEALHLFDLLDAHAHDHNEGGYFEGCTRDWQVLPGAKLSELEPPAPKSTNTTLHVLEAYTELLRCHPTLRVAAMLRELIDIFLTRLWLPEQRCFGLFFTRDWKNLTPQVSWGHDIEAAWLLVRAAQVLGDTDLLQRVRTLALEVAQAVLQRGVASDGRLLGAGDFDGSVTDRRSHWWCQAEAMLGFWDAWQISGDERFANAAWRNWQYIDQHHVDRQRGDWFKILDEHGVPMNEVPKAGPWECPYHHVRACLEMSERLTSAALTP
jgi:mannobiose 2-epimerase